MKYLVDFVVTKQTNLVSEVNDLRGVLELLEEYGIELPGIRVRLLTRRIV